MFKSNDFNTRKTGQNLSVFLQKQEMVVNKSNDQSNLSRAKSMKNYLNYGNNKANIEEQISQRPTEFSGDRMSNFSDENFRKYLINASIQMKTPNNNIAQPFVSMQDQSLVLYDDSSKQNYANEINKNSKSQKKLIERFENKNEMIFQENNCAKKQLWPSDKHVNEKQIQNYQESQNASYSNKISSSKNKQSFQTQFSFQAIQQKIASEKQQFLSQSEQKNKYVQINERNKRSRQYDQFKNTKDKQTHTLSLQQQQDDDNLNFNLKEDLDYKKNTRTPVIAQHSQKICRIKKDFQFADQSFINASAQSNSYDNKKEEIRRNKVDQTVEYGVKQSNKFLEQPGKNIEDFDGIGEDIEEEDVANEDHSIERMTVKSHGMLSNKSLKSISMRNKFDRVMKSVQDVRLDQDQNNTMMNRLMGRVKSVERIQNTQYNHSLFPENFDHRNQLDFLSQQNSHQKHHINQFSQQSNLNGNFTVQNDSDKKKQKFNIQSAYHRKNIQSANCLYSSPQQLFRNNVVQINQNKIGKNIQQFENIKKIVEKFQNSQQIEQKISESKFQRPFSFDNQKSKNIDILMNENNHEIFSQKIPQNKKFEQHFEKLRELPNYRLMVCKCNQNIKNEKVLNKNENNKKIKKKLQEYKEQEEEKNILITVSQEDGNNFTCDIEEDSLEYVKQKNNMINGICSFTPDNDSNCGNYCKYLQSEQEREIIVNYLRKCIQIKKQQKSKNLQTIKESIINEDSEDEQSPFYSQVKTYQSLLINYKENDKCYLISAAWWREWCDYANFNLNALYYNESQIQMSGIHSKYKTGNNKIYLKQQSIQEHTLESTVQIATNSNINSSQTFTVQNSQLSKISNPKFKNQIRNPKVLQMQDSSFNIIFLLQSDKKNKQIQIIKQKNQKNVLQKNTQQFKREETKIKESQKQEKSQINASVSNHQNKNSDQNSISQSLSSLDQKRQNEFKQDLQKLKQQTKKNTNAVLDSIKNTKIQNIQQNKKNSKIIDSQNRSKEPKQISTHVRKISSGDEGTEMSEFGQRQKFQESNLDSQIQMPNIYYKKPGMIINSNILKISNNNQQMQNNALMLMRQSKSLMNKGSIQSQSNQDQNKYQENLFGNSMNNMFQSLKEDLIEHFDYEAVDQQMWNYLKAWYGTDVQIMRIITKDNINSNQLYLDLYPEKRRFQLGRGAPAQ